MPKRFRTNDELSADEEQCPIKIVKLEMNRKVCFKKETKENLITISNMKLKVKQELTKTDLCIKQEFEEEISDSPSNVKVLSNIQEVTHNDGFTAKEQLALDIIQNLPIGHESNMKSEMNPDAEIKQEFEEINTINSTILQNAPNNPKI